MTTKKEAGNSLPNLQKTASSSELQNYFTAIIDLKKSGKEFPVNIDEVYRLLYKRRDNAIRDLKSSFIENEDFLLLKNEEQKNRRGGSNKIDYFLTTQCLEYFIAKKKREVFEVYRTVFHKAVEGKQKAISKEATHIEGQVFVGKLGNYTTHNVYLNGEIYTKTAGIASFLGQMNGFSKAIMDKLGENALKVQIGKQMIWFANYEGVKLLLSNLRTNPTYYELECIHYDIFGVVLTSNQENEIFEYKYTGSEMAKILIAISKKPINRDSIVQLLEEGGQNV